MTRSKTPIASNPWDLLQQPARPSGAIDARYRLLLAALDQGWEVEEPVYFCPREKEGGNWVFHFVLTQPAHNQKQILTISDHAEVEYLISQEGWPLDRRRSVGSCELS
jgi:hypothetical protein